jgi:tellurite resistance protein TerC
MTTLLSLAADASDAPGADIVAEPWMWGGFVALIALLLMLDLFVFHRDSHVVEFREALKFSIFWISLGVLFTGVVFLLFDPQGHGGDAATQYITGFLIEKSLSIDNVFVWAVIFTFFAVPPQYQHRTLFWGIFGALVLRAIFIFAGVALLDAVSWIVYIFGAFLLFTAYRIWTHDEMEVHPEKNPVLNAIKRVIPSTNDFREHHFFVKEEHKGTVRRLMTPLFAVLVMIEITDVVFAIDSIPAILAVSRSEFIVFSSNAFAILGLRSLYFLLAGLADKFRYLNNGLAIILGYVGVKFMIVELYHVPTYVSLAVIAVVLTVTILLSIRADKNDPQSSADAVDDPTDGPPAVVEADPDDVTSGADVVEAPQPDPSNDPV